MRVDVAGVRCSALAAASVASTRMASAMRGWRTVELATATAGPAVGAVRRDWAWRLRRQEGR